MSAFDGYGGLEMKRNNRHGSKLLFSALFLLLLTACGTTAKNLVVDSSPQRALVVVQPVEGFPSLLVKGELVMRETSLGETPAAVEVRFMSDAAKVTLTAEKRGYASSSREVTKDSTVPVFFDLKRLDGVPEATFKPENLALESYSLLPTFVEVHIRSGVGRLDKVEFSPQSSRKVTEELNTELARTLASGSGQIHQVSIDASLQPDWQNIVTNLNAYLLQLNPTRLRYYSLPPYLNSKVGGFKPFIGRFSAQQGKDKPYFLYVWIKCIAETAGRKAGNILLSALGPVATVANRGYVYDPAAFLPNSGTLVVIHVIDAKSSEVVHIEQHAFADITDGEALRALAGAIGKYPVVEEKLK